MKRVFLLVVCSPLVLASCEWLAGIRELDASKDAGQSVPDGSVGATDIDATTPQGGTDAALPRIDAGLLAPALSRRLALGSTHSCVVRSDAKAYCWGSNATGQLGTGPAIQPEARAVPGLTDVLSIVAGATHTCALDKKRHVLCWGKNDNNQLGGKPDASGIVDVNLDNKPALQVAAGVRHTCALVGTGSVACWGDNAFGQLGNGTTKDTTTSVVPTGLESNVMSIFAAGFFTCAVKSNESMVCWGDNTFGQMGDRTKTVRPSPVAVRDLEVAVKDVGLGQFNSCAITVGGGLSCWGRNRLVGEPTLGYGVVVPFVGSPAEVTSPALRGDAGVPAPLLTSVALGPTHACARTLADNALCWGSNGKGQLGVDADGGAFPGYHDVPGLAGVVKEIGVGLGHSCALAPNDEVYCWGQNDVGQLGAPTSGPRAKPDRVRFAQ